MIDRRLDPRALLPEVVESLRRGEDPFPLAHRLLSGLEAADSSSRSVEAHRKSAESNTEDALATLSGSVDLLAQACHWLLDRRIDATSFRGILEQLALAPPPVATDRYRIGSLLGEGGMGQVFAAEDTQLGRGVAAKFLKERMDPARFQDEARLTARLEHPNIVPIHDIGIDQQGCPFYIMKRVEGRPLDAYLASGMPPLSERLDIFLRVCDALVFAHEQGVIHCDLKPANVMVDRNGEVRVMDWGLAQAETGGNASGGTRAYMAPEQILEEPVDARVDVYALGELLWELLTGRPAFQGSAEEIRALKLAGHLTPPPRGVPVPRELETVALRAMSRAPRDRHPDAAALRAAVRAFQEGRLVPDLRYAPWEQAGKWAGRHRGVVATALVGLLILLGGAARYTLDIRARNAEILLAKRLTELRLARALAADGWVEEARDILKPVADGQDLLAGAARMAQATLAWGHGAPLRFWRIQPDHPGMLTGGLSPDGRQALVSSRERGSSRVQVSLWSVPGPSLLSAWETEVESHNEEPPPVRWVDGRPLVFLVDPSGQAFRVVDPRTGEEVWSVRDPALPGARYEVHLPPTGRFVLLNDRLDGCLRSRLFAFGNPTPLREWEPCVGDGLDDSGSWMVRDPGTDLGPAILDVASGQETALDYVQCTLFSPDSSRVACWKESSLLVKDVATGQTLWSNKGRLPRPAAFLSGGDELLVSTNDGAYQVVGAERGESRRLPCFHEDGTNLATASADGSLLLLTGKKGTAALMDLSEAGQRFALTQPGVIPCLAVSPDSRLALTCSAGERAQIGDPLVRLFELGTGALLRDLDTGAPGVRGVAFSPDGRRAVSADRAGRVILWDLVSGARVRDFVTGDPKAMGAAFLPDGRVVGAGSEGFLGLWDPESGSLLWSTRQPGQAWDMDVSPDGRFLAVSDRGGATPALSLWAMDRLEPRLLWRWEPASTHFYRLAFSPDSLGLAATTNDSQVLLWDLPGDGHPRTDFSTPANPVTAVAFSADARLLASGGADNTIRLWDSERGVELWSVLAHEQMINDLAFTPDGRYLLSAGDEGRVALLDLAFPTEQRDIEAYLDAHPNDPAALGRLMALHRRWDLALPPLNAAHEAGDRRFDLDLARALWQAGRKGEAQTLLSGFGDEHLSAGTRAIWMSAP